MADPGQPASGPVPLTVVRSAGGAACPRCDSPLERVPRRWRDRVLSLWFPVRRYRCTGWQCGWEGVLLRRADGTAPARPRPATRTDRRR